MRAGGARCLGERCILDSLVFLSHSLKRPKHLWERKARLRVSASCMFAPGLWRMISSTSLYAQSHHSSRIEALMSGSLALPEFAAQTAAQLSEKSSTTCPLQDWIHLRVPTNRLKHSTEEMLNCSCWKLWGSACA